MKDEFINIENEQALTYPDIRLLYDLIKPTKKTEKYYDIVRNYLFGDMRQEMFVTEQIVAFCKGRRIRKGQEEIHVISMDHSYRVIRDDLVSIGIQDASIWHPREVFRNAIAANAFRIVLWHTHPEILSLPSNADERMTRRVWECGRILGIPLADSLIINEGENDQAYSFAEHGYLRRWEDSTMKSK